VNAPRLGGRKGRCGPASFAGSWRATTGRGGVDREVDGGSHFLTGPARRGHDPSVESGVRARQLDVELHVEAVTVAGVAGLAELEGAAVLVVDHALLDEQG
jgi:hypothetical protein